MACNFAEGAVARVGLAPHALPMLVLAALLACTQLPEDPIYPAIEPSPFVFSLPPWRPEQPWRRYSIDGTPTNLETPLRDPPAPTAHHLDHARYLVLPGASEPPRLWDATTRTLHHLPLGVAVCPAPGVGMVLLKSDEDGRLRVMQLARDAPTLHPLVESESRPRALGRERTRLVSLRGSRLVYLDERGRGRAERATLAELRVVGGCDAIRDGKLLMVRMPTFAGKPCAEQPEYSADVAVLDLRSRVVETIGAARGSWQWFLIGRETCPEPKVRVRWLVPPRLFPVEDGVFVEARDEVDVP